MVAVSDRSIYFIANVSMPYVENDTMYGRTGWQWGGSTPLSKVSVYDIPTRLITQTSRLPLSSRI